MLSAESKVAETRLIASVQESIVIIIFFVPFPQSPLPLIPRGGPEFPNPQSPIPLIPRGGPEFPNPQSPLSPEGAPSSPIPNPQSPTKEIHKCTLLVV
ncbi:hypothetical protein FDUTEX481_02820 [Tolypothrix sp. PCC 7601]|nr:hypothetical protein FDUTEX481_02820 [Tolypothrix sp. PCC 7601]